MSAESYLQHPLYQLAAKHFQQGEWKAGLTEVERLIKLFPSEQELRSLRNEFLFKERLDGAEVGDRVLEGRQKLRWLLTRAAMLALAVVAAYLVFRTYSGWMGQQLNSASERVQQEIRVATIFAKRMDAEALIQVGRLDEAEAVVDEIAQLDPSFAGLVELRASITNERQLANLYEQAMQQIDAREWLGARASLVQLATQQPNYRDVDIQLMYIDRQTLLGNMLSEGEAAIAQANWEQAVVVLENVRTLHPNYEPEYVEARLFESYVSAAQAVLVGQEDSLVALEQAEDHLREALALRPQDPDIKRERELAGLFLAAQNDFDQGNWSDVIETLSAMIVVDPNYAQGTARQTAYDAYVARGEILMAVHSYQQALADFERALALAKQDEGAGLRLYEAELKVAEAYGATSNFEAAVVHYRAATDWGNLAALGEENPSLRSALQQAEVYASAGNFGVAYERYQRAMRLATNSQATRTHVVESGEYLTLLASRYGSTVRAIAQANDIENQNLIFPGQELIIPVLP
jgi:tetratricopeptide (TPR) repeat protein